ncbi:hypothetical protein F8568_035845 [Actinomadura sp. LD22]|uniref:ABC transporter ATP-binding protein n=1 Tax=Actinomadura physcomitrii TaxID=2650748 RepID=A0A6I4MQK2_9ACTN|nr:hypothetical protein [Actinomadura physcomitrii]MWA05641.1 hypothetical protein [Actinomadura physcomitrii]
MDGLSRAFGGVTAVEDLRPRAAAGQVVSVIGPDGAGKISDRVTVLQTGRIVLDGPAADLAATTASRPPTSATTPSPSPAEQARRY